MYVKVSSWSPSVAFDTVVELSAVRTMVYGFFPPATERFHAWHVESESVTFGVIVAKFLEGVETQDDPDAGAG